MSEHTARFAAVARSGEAAQVGQGAARCKGDCARIAAHLGRDVVLHPVLRVIENVDFNLVLAAWAAAEVANTCRKGVPASKWVLHEVTPLLWPLCMLLPALLLT